MSLAGGLGGLYPTRNLGFKLTLFQPSGEGGGQIMPTTFRPPVFENLRTSLHKTDSISIYSENQQLIRNT